MALVKVSADDWANFVSDYRTIATERQAAEGMSCMDLKHHRTGELIGVVDYLPGGQRDYWIFTGVKAPKLYHGVNAQGCAFTKELEK